MITNRAAIGIRMPVLQKKAGRKILKIIFNILIIRNFLEEVINLKVYEIKGFNLL